MFFYHVFKISLTLFIPIKIKQLFHDGHLENIKKKHKKNRFCHILHFGSFLSANYLFKEYRLEGGGW